MKTIKNITAEEGSIRAQILEDADGEISYIKDAAEQGCIGGNCSGLVSYADTHAFYTKHADEIDEMLEEAYEMYDYNVGENMKRLGQSDLRNFLAWFAYEVRAQEIMSEME